LKNSLVKSSFGVTIILIGGYFLSFVKEAVVASYLGVSNIADAYTIAIQIPVTLFSFVAVSINSIVIPLYTDKLYKEGNFKANLFVNNFLNTILILSVLFIIFGELFSGYIIYLFAPGFSIETHNLATTLLRITFPTVIFTAVTQLLTAVLNSNKKFVLPSLSVYLLNIGLIITIVLLYTKIGVKAACLGQIIGAFFQLSFILVIAKKYFKYKFYINLKDKELIKAAKMSLPVMWSISVAQINAIVNRIVASFFFVGTIAALSYASKLNTVFSSLFISAISTIVFPLYAEATAKNNLKQLNKLFNFTISTFSLFIIPLILGLIIYKTEIITIAFARGAFDLKAINTTKELFLYYTFGLLFMAFRQTVTRVFYSLKDTKTPAKNATLGVIINIVLNLTLPFIMGAKGLALSASISAMIISLRLIYLLKKRYKEIILKNLFISLKKIILASIIMMLAVLLFKIYVPIENNIIALISGAFVCISIYIVTILLFKTKIAFEILNKLKNDKNCNKR